MRVQPDLEKRKRLIEDLGLKETGISEGKRREGEPPFMPWWGRTLTEQEIGDLVAFIRSLAGEGPERGVNPPRLPKSP